MISCHLLRNFNRRSTRCAFRGQRRLTNNKSADNNGKQQSSPLIQNASSKMKVDKNAERDALDFLAERGRATGYQLSFSERKLILKEAGANERLSKQDWEKLVSKRYLVEQERRTLSHYLAASHDGTSQYLLKNTARLGIAFFALTSSHTAGEAGMHVFGSTLVGCVAALGGGTLNGVIIGALPVGWVVEPASLLITVGASLIGFYVWPLVEGSLSDAEKKGSDEDGVSAHRYVMESVALGALAVTGAQQGIIRGLHPLISASLGVTIAFGGVLRDLMCKRDLALGAATGCQSYGIASFSGAAVYVALRQLHVWNCSGSTQKLIHGGIPLGLRILLGFGTVFSIRAVAWHYKPDGILSTMDDSATANKKRIQQLFHR